MSAVHAVRRAEQQSVMATSDCTQTHSTHSLTQRWAVVVVVDISPGHVTQSPPPDVAAATKLK